MFINFQMKIMKMVIKNFRTYDKLKNKIYKLIFPIFRELYCENVVFDF